MARTVKRKPEAHERSRRMKIRPAYVVLLIVMGFFAFKFVEKTRELQQLTRQATLLRAENQKTMRDNARIKRDINYFKTTQYVEQQARALFGYTRPGDVAIVTKPAVRQAPVLRHAAYRAAPATPTWKEWWDSFFH
jgi:cell division protein FtsB